MDETERSPVEREAPEGQREMGLEEAERCKEVVLKLKKSAHGGPFLYPVDPLRLNVPDYYDKIKHPMDLSTISKKLETNEYASAEGVERDIELMLSNCYLYNLPDSPVYKMGQSLEKYYKQIWQKKGLGTKKKTEEEEESKKPRKQSMEKEDLKKCTDAMAEILRPKYHKFTWPFLEAVDVNLVPTYYTMIKHPMDLGLMRGKLASGKYSSMEGFLADFDLMVSNCYQFNAPGSEVYLCAVKLSTQFKQLFEQKKKKTGEKPADNAEERIAELKSQISQCEAEIRRLEKKMGIDPAEFGYDEKKRLKRRIESLTVDKLKNVVSFLQKTVSSAIVTEMDEIEVNLDMLEHSILVKLSDIVRDAYVEEQRIETDSSSE